MDLEQLNKSQIVLLTMLVSFVTSIATGIVTVSLVEEAPTDVTRVVQRVVERTVEKVAPAESQQATVITKEKTIIIKESDLIAVAIAENKSRVVSIVDAETKSFISLGVFIDTDGTVAVDASTLEKDVTTYMVLTGPESLLEASVTYSGGARGVALLKVKDATQVTESMVVTTSGATLQLGQTVIGFIGDGAVSQGIITSLGERGYIGTSITGLPVAPGSPLLTVDGEVIGISTGVSKEVGLSVFAPIRTAVAQQSADANATETTAVASTTATTTNASESIE